MKKDSDSFNDLEDDGFLTLYPYCPAGEYPTIHRKDVERLCSQINKNAKVKTPERDHWSEDMKKGYLAGVNHSTALIRGMLHKMEQDASQDFPDLYQFTKEGKHKTRGFYHILRDTFRALKQDNCNGNDAKETQPS